MIDIPLASWVLFIGFLFLWASYQLYQSSQGDKKQ